MNVANIEEYKLKLKYDGQVSISTGKNRFETNWKNKKILWSNLVAKLKTPVTTHESYEDYKKFSKTEQDQIKDVGGYIGGSLTGGRRKSGSVATRQILTLDLDFAPSDFFDTLEILTDYACCVYSTHKHSPETPRYRLLIPLDREVTPDEYEAISRRIAADIGIDYFDDTTYQPSRLMYWPSVSSDGAYYYNYLDNPFLSAIKVLGTYEDWTDTSYWPESSRAVSGRKKMADKQGDPCDKPGLIGAFCRTYTIPEAIETFIPDAYIKCDMPNRYTFTGGSTAAGLVVYEDEKFAYSNHATDPASGKLCNAFDLVRLHKFAELDDEVAADTKTISLPSYKAMIALTKNDNATKLTAGSEKIESAKIEFEELLDNTSWMTKLEMNNRGEYLDTIDNVKLILTYDPNLKGITGFNTFNFKLTVLRNPPWRKVTPDTNAWVDLDDSGLRHYLEHVYGITGITKITDALEIVQEVNKFHPVRDYLDDLEWDRVERLDNLFIDYLGAEDSEYTRVVTRKMLVAAVARIYSPGIKFDYMLVLVGVQGLGKSYILKVIGKDWYSDSFSTVVGKESYEQLHGNWILEMAELTAAKKTEVEAVKHFISKQEDIYRAAYAKRTKSYARQCVFFGTTNDAKFLRDRTGNRRFWPLACGEGFTAKDLFKELQEEVDQMWAEAKYRWLQKEPLYLDVRMNDIAIEKQKAHTEQDIRQGMVEEFLSMKLPANWSTMDTWSRQEYIRGNLTIGEGEETIERSCVCAAEVWCELFGNKPGTCKRIDAREINSILDSIDGWEKSEKVLRFSGEYGVQKGYIKL